MTSTTDGSFVWYELLSTDPFASMPFYERVLGFASRRLDGVHGHVMYATAAGPMASATTLPAQAKQMGASSFWNANVQVPNVDEACAKAKLLGGNVLHPPLDVPGIGRVAVIADPCGAVLNVFAPAAPMPAHERALPGEVCWHELVAEDPDRALAFYAGLFGWARSGQHDMGPLGRYALFGCGGPDLGGVFKRPPGVPVSAWVYYFQVADVDRATECARQHGGEVLGPPMTIPSGARVARLRDPQGAILAVHENPKPRASS